ncbi:NADH-quinone oxidoreductase subunit L [Sorangium sp. So ce1036]|uniref:NADH-quinone oxidoreductase subunit 5 family protein n=1 Tax=Sorangium sp. So ce1036 TaxID=3133328 RepID=UPI003F02391F
MSDYSGQVTHVHASLAPLWWIPLLPLLGAVTNALFGRALQRSAFGRELSRRLHIGSFGVTLVAVSAMIGAFLLGIAGLVALVGLPPGERYLYSFAWQMVRIGSLDVNFAFAMDPLSCLMTLIITGVGTLIHVYAASYMEAEPSYWRFFTYLNLFVFSMLLLVLGDNFIVMFFGWEGVGLCSYLLIGFWYRDYKKASAGMKAFVVNRIGDWGFVVGLALLFWGLGARWLDDGRFLSDYRARFIAVEAEPHGGHGEAGREAAGRGAAGGARDAGEGGERGPASLVGARGYLTFTGHPGARVYLGIADAAQLASNPRPFGVSPFVRKEIPAGAHSVVIVPGDGAVIAGDGNEIAAIERMRVSPGKEVVLATVGSTVTFREIHDQLVIKDASGKAFLKEALESKTAWGGAGLITVACLFLFVGAVGKSAQIPLYVWLPDAMAGPTPVSALIHAATMVTAGVYLIARLCFLFSLSPTASGVIALIGAATALFAATIGFFQYDIKKVLAYSTVSQLGFMFIGVGVGAYWAAAFHLMTHAFFKACLFLGSGSVIHGMHAVLHGEEAAQDMRNMGGLRRVMPRTARAYQVACLAITAAPIPFFAGFWSKDEILWKAFGTENTGPIPGLLIYAMGLAAAFCTSFYMWRSYYLTFEGPHAREEIATKVHESPPAITWVLAILAALSALAGVVFGFSSHFVGGHGEPLLEEWLHPVLAHAEVSFKPHGLGLELALMALSVGGAIVAFSRARARYGARRSPRWAEEERRLPGYVLLSNRYYVDEIYDATVVRGFMALRLFLAEMDRWIVDGIVNGVAVLSRAAAWVTGAIDRHLVDGVVNAVAEGTLRAGAKLRALQTGRIQSYIYFLLGGVALFSIVRYFLR